MSPDPSDRLGHKPSMSDMQFLNQGWGLPRGWWAVPWLSVESHHQSAGSTSLSFSGCPETFSGPSSKRPTFLDVTMAGGHPSQLNYCGGGTAGCPALVQPPRGASKLDIGMSAHNMEEDRHGIKGFAF